MFVKGVEQLLVTFPVRVERGERPRRTFCKLLNAMPAKAGIQVSLPYLDPRLGGNALVVSFYL
jgi:hypothetical protein